jgi:hypothetical protein
MLHDATPTLHLCSTCYLCYTYTTPTYTYTTPNTDATPLLHLCYTKLHNATLRYTYATSMLHLSTTPTLHLCYTYATPMLYYVLFCSTTLPYSSLVFQVAYLLAKFPRGAATVALVLLLGVGSGLTIQRAV